MLTKIFKNIKISVLGASIAVAAGVSMDVSAGNLAEKIANEGKVAIGVGYLAPPMNYIDDKGEHVGFDVDLAVGIAKQMGLDYELVKVNNKTRVSFLATGKVGFVVSSMNHTLGRDNVIDFSEVYLRDGKRLLVKRGRFSKIEDLVGKRIAVVQGSNAGTAIKEKLIGLGDDDPKIMSFQNNAECFLALKTGKVDAYTNDTVIMLGVSDGDKSFELIGDIYSPTFFSIGVPENQSDWRDQLNYALREMHLNGSYDKIYNKWFGTGAKYELPAIAQGPDIWPM